jgi:hypothetical protein
VRRPPGRALQALGCALALACGDFGGAGPEPRPYSVQLHVHGSFSEGIGSIDSHSREASDVGVDVIWWSDHDDIIASWRRVSTFGFEDAYEPIERGETWHARTERERAQTKGLYLPDRLLHGSTDFVTRAHVGERSLRLRLASPAPEFQTQALVFFAKGSRHRRPLASRVRVHLAVFPIAAGPDARVFVQFRLSEHPASAGDGFELHHLEYELDNVRSERRLDGPTLSIPLPYRVGKWNTYTLEVTRDAVEGFRSIAGEDNAFSQLALGVRSRLGAAAEVLFDDLRIEQELSGEDLFARQRELIEQVGRRYPSVQQLQGVEISGAGQHLNEFSVETRLLDYEELIQRSGLLRGDPPTLDDAFGPWATRRAVEAAHARGGLVSYNHMFGVSHPGARPTQTRQQVLEQLLETRAFEADLLEVGYRDRGGHLLEDHLWVWDQLALRGLYLVGTGVSDSHGGDTQRWRTSANNFVSWIYADASSKPALIEGLRAGRVFFGDRVRFDGELDLASERGFRMGRIVLTDREAVDVAIEVDGLAAGDQVLVVESGEATRRYSADGPVFRHIHPMALPSSGPAFVRVEARGQDGAIKVLGNPLLFVREAPAAGLPAARAGLDVGGVVGRAFARFELSAAELGERDGTRLLRLEGRGENGEILLDCSEPGAPSEVRLDGITGTSKVGSRDVVLSELRGSGSIELVWPAGRSN